MSLNTQALFVFLASLLIPALSQFNPFAPRIVGGKNATRGQFPFLSFVEIYQGGYYQGSCGGSLVAPDVILTAAHCCFCGDANFQKFNIYLNMYNTDYLDGSSPARPDACTEIHADITERSCHPGYDVRENDFCLIRLNRPSVYKPAVLYDSAKITTKPDAYGKPVVIAGYGSFDGQNRVADNLLKAEITVANTTRCLEKYVAYSESYGFTPALVICGNVSTGKDACVGDSGGPMFTKVGTDLVVIGVTSRGADGCNTHYNLDGIYGRVDTQSFRDFANPILKPSKHPTLQPSRQPSRQPTSKPTKRPTFQPTSKPTRVPTLAPSKKPTRHPTDRPTRVPSRVPTRRPSRVPSVAPTRKPTKTPTDRPTRFPTKAPTFPTSTRAPTQDPTTKYPTVRPTKRPSMKPTSKPTRRPTNQPSRRPSRAPSTKRPTPEPTSKPTRVPTAAPSKRPSRSPTFKPTRRPTLQPGTRAPTPTRAPTFRASCVVSTFP